MHCLCCNVKRVISVLHSLSQEIYVFFSLSPQIIKSKQIEICLSGMPQHCELPFAINRFLRDSADIDISNNRYLAMDMHHSHHALSILVHAVWVLFVL